MKLLFDQNLAPTLVSLLGDVFPDSAHVSTVGLDDSSDVGVWEFARASDFTIVTKDSDLSEISLLRGYPPSVVWIRKGNCTTSDIEAIIRKNLEQMKQLDGLEPGGILILY